MPNLLRQSISSFDVVTWKWISENHGEPRGRKRSQPELTDISSAGLDSEQDEPEDGLKIWGYMPGHVHFNLGHTNGRVSMMLSFKECSNFVQPSLKKEASDSTDQVDMVEGVLHTVPPRSITGMVTDKP